MGSQTYNFTGYFPDQNSMACQIYDENALAPQNQVMMVDENNFTQPTTTINSQIQNEQPNYGFVPIYSNSWTGGDNALNQDQNSSKNSSIMPNYSVASQNPPSCEMNNHSQMSYSLVPDQIIAQNQVYPCPPPRNIIASLPQITLPEQQLLEEEKKKQRLKRGQKNSYKYREKQRAKCNHLDKKVQPKLPSMLKSLRKLQNDLNILKQLTNHPCVNSAFDISMELMGDVKSMEYHEKPQTP